MVRVALAVIHGIGTQDPGYADAFMARVRKRFTAHLGPVPSASDCLAARVLVLSGILRTPEHDLLSLTRRHRRLGWARLRGFMADYVGDAIGYQRTERADIYRATHSLVAEELNALDEAAGPGAPLAIAAHSLGSVVLSNYIWDLQVENVPEEVKPFLRTSTSRLENLAHFYTLGSPLAMWTLRYPRFGRPIRFPAGRLSSLKTREWVNFYDADDVIAYPLRGLSDDYARAVTRDCAVNVGSWLTCWNPLSHTGYWSSNRIADHVASRLAEDWKTLNQPIPEVAR